MPDSAASDWGHALFQGPFYGMVDISGLILWYNYAIIRGFHLIQCCTMGDWNFNQSELSMTDAALLVVFRMFTLAEEFH